jgi:hypothetical protein
MVRDSEVATLRERVVTLEAEATIHRAELAAEREKTRIAVAKFETIRDQYPKTDVAHSFAKEALAAIAAVRMKP